MKKPALFDNLRKENLTHNKNKAVHKFKTTNVNILLNRVRTNNKRKLRRKIIFVSILFFIISIFSYISLA